MPAILNSSAHRLPPLISYSIEKSPTVRQEKDLVLVFVITVTCALSAAASDARSEAADEAAPPAAEGLAGPPELGVHPNLCIGN